MLLSLEKEIRRIFLWLKISLQRENWKENSLILT